jgi:hypothetical protein
VPGADGLIDADALDRLGVDPFLVTGLIVEGLPRDHEFRIKLRARGLIRDGRSIFQDRLPLSRAKLSKARS